MATAAFKSTSRRGTRPTIHSSENSIPPNPEPPQRRRRSLSVSAASRTLQSPPEIPTEFSNKRDNPLFWSKDSDPIDAAPQVANSSSKPGSSHQRGRSVTRNSGVGGKKELGRSLSRVDTGRRRRSVSRGHFGASESEVEPESITSSNFRNRNDLNADHSSEKKFSLVRNVADSRIRVNDSQMQLNSVGNVADSMASRLRIPNWEDRTSAGEAEERTIKAVCEQMKSYPVDNAGHDVTTSGIYETVRSEVRRAISEIQSDLESAIRKSNATSLANASITDIPPDLVNPEAIELVLDIRREYAKKLEESKERARKLQADLAIEEHRGQELSRILKEILPDPKTPMVQRSLPGRKNSSERRKMSKRLTEEAMAYFDECVSISTFDGSDFSASEDPPFNSFETTVPAASGGHAQLLLSCEDSRLTANSTSGEDNTDLAIPSGNNTNSYGNFAEDIGFRENFSSYIKHFEKAVDKDGMNSEILRLNYYDVDRYTLQEHKESFLFDRVLYNNRIESGGLHLCCGGSAISFSPFASVI